MNQPGGEQARGRMSQGAKEPGGEPAKVRKSHNSALRLPLNELAVYFRAFRLIVSVGLSAVTRAGKKHRFLKENFYVLP